jgi:membrane dipeptidase
MNLNNYPLLVDSHEDMAWNMLTFKRDYTLSSQQIRDNEKETGIPEKNGDTLLGWEDYQTANVGLVFSTLFGSPARTHEGDWDSQCYKDQNEAYKVYRKQLEVYFRLTDENPDKFRMVRNRRDLTELLSFKEVNKNSGSGPIGLIPLMEGADGIRRPQELPEWVEMGVRLIGLAWQATAYCGGTREPGPLTAEGFQLLKEMEQTGCILDFSHMDEKAVWQSLDAFSGRMMVSHANPLHFLHERNSNRFLSDDVIRAVVERKAVIGLVPYNVFLDPYWKEADGKDQITIDRYVEQIDYVCQLVGSADYVGIGTDFDGGFGRQHTPAEINTIADIPIIIPMLQEKGYSLQDIDKIFGKNWINFLMEALPAS